VGVEWDRISLPIFSKINPAATGFAALCVLQAILLAASATATNGLRFSVEPDLRSASGLSLIIYALRIYPILGIWAGQGLTAGSMFGMAPCPTTIFTIGMLLLARVVWLSIIPFLWCLVGLAAAVQLGISEDFGLPVAGIVLLVAVESDGFNGGREDRVPIGKDRRRSS
jgi:hypothetical protein